MRPYDKFGKWINPDAFNRLKAIAYLLETYGYKEIASRPNLFIRAKNGIAFFADMRGTEGRSIWKLPLPSFYWQVEDDRTRYDESVLQKAWIEVNRIFDVPMTLFVPDSDRIRRAPTGQKIRHELYLRTNEFQKSLPGYKPAGARYWSEITRKMMPGPTFRNWD